MTQIDTNGMETEALQRLRAVAAGHTPAVLASSFGVEDMVLIDLIDRHDLDIGVFTLDTGRLPEETYRLIAETRQRYRVALSVFAPEAAAVEAYVANHGPNGFYESALLRQECCYIRKVKPLKRALAGKSAWITGQRREQSPTRRDLPFEEWDADNGMAKFNPLADWSGDEVWDYIRRYSVPTNALHQAGYTSIGCAPCTRAIQPGEDVRAGRWWWENPEHKECGLHLQSQSS